MANGTGGLSGTMKTKWLNSAMKSIGASAASSFKSLYPNISDVGEAGFKASKNIVSSITQSRVTVNKVTDRLKNSKYVQFAHKAYNNALNDFKSGKFDNTERMLGFDEDMFSGFDDFGETSFGEEDTPVTNNISVNADSGTKDAVLKLSDNVNKQSESMIKTSKASMDAFISISAASMYQVEKLGGEINTHLNNINNSLASIIQYQNENMTKFMEASMAFYESMGSRVKSEDGFKNEKVTGKATFSNQRGGINLGQYKKYVKQQLKENLPPEVTLVVDMLDDSTLEMITSNPLGLAVNAMTTYMIPKLIGTTISSVEKTFETFVPTMLERLVDFGNTYSDTMFGKATRYLAKSFGLKKASVSNLKSARIERGATPFDGETKHAITQIITKELRDQTAYLRAISERIAGKKKTSDSLSKREYWDYVSGGYVTQDKLRGSISKQLKDALISGFDSTDFYKKIVQSFSSESEKSQKSLTMSFNKLLSELAKSQNKVNLDNDRDLTNILKKALDNGANSNDLKFIKEKIQSLDVRSRQTSNIGRFTARQNINDAVADLSKNAESYNLRDAGVNGEDPWKLIDESIRDKKGVDVPSIYSEDSRSSNGLIGKLISPITKRATAFMEAVMAGDMQRGRAQFRGVFADSAKSVYEVFRDSALIPIGDTLKNKILMPIKKSLFGERTEDGHFKGGLTSGIRNSLSDIFKAVKHEVTGEEYTDSEGRKHAAKRDNVVDSVKSVGTKVKRSVMTELFGEDEIDENGEKTGNKKTPGLLNSWKVSLTNEFGRFKSFLFGKKDELMSSIGDNTNWGGFISRDSQEYLKENGVKLGIGSIGGGLIGTLFGGPLLGASIGLASSIASSSKSFNSFLFGDKEQLGLIKGIKDAFKKGRGSYGASDTNFNLDAQFVGKAGVGILGGVIASAFLPGGPVFGGLLGLGATIASSGKDFKRFLFGSEEYDKDLGKTVHKHGLLGKMGNMINAQFLRPVKTQLNYYIKKTSLDLQYTIGDTVNFLSEEISERVGVLVGKIQTRFAKMANATASFLKKNVVDRLQDIVRTTLVEPVSKAVTGAASLVYTIGRRAIIGPIEKIHGLMSIAYSRVAEWWQQSSLKNFIDTGKGWLKRQIKNTLKWIARGAVGAIKFSLSPLSLAFKGMKGFGTILTHALNKHGIKLEVPGFIKNKYQGIKDKFSEDLVNEWDVEGATRAQRWRKRQASKRIKSAELKKQHKEQKIRNKNAKLIERATKGQYSSDTAEARMKAALMNPNLAAKLDKSVATEDQVLQEAKAKVAGRSSFGVARELLSGLKFATLSPESQAVVLLDELIRVMKNEDNEPSEAAKKFKNSEEFKNMTEEDRVTTTSRLKNEFYNKYTSNNENINFDEVAQKISESDDPDKDKLLAMNQFNKELYDEKSKPGNPPLPSVNNGNDTSDNGSDTSAKPNEAPSDPIDYYGGVRNWMKAGLKKSASKRASKFSAWMEESYANKNRTKLVKLYNNLTKAITSELKYLAANSGKGTFVDVPLLDYFGSRVKSDYQSFIKLGNEKFAEQIMTSGSYTIGKVTIDAQTLLGPTIANLLKQSHDESVRQKASKLEGGIQLDSSEGLKGNKLYDRFQNTIKDHETYEENARKRHQQPTTGSGTGHGGRGMFITHNPAPNSLHGGRGLLGLALGLGGAAVRGVLGVGKAIGRGVTGVGKSIVGGVKKGATTIGNVASGALNKIRGKGITQQDVIDAKQREQDRVTMEAIRENTAVSAQTDVEHAASWKKMFGKKGLIAAGLLLAMPKIIKGFKWLTGGGLTKILTGTGEVVKTFINEGPTAALDEIKTKAEEIFPGPMKVLESVCGKISKWHEEIDATGNVFTWADNKLKESNFGGVYESAKTLLSCYSKIGSALMPAVLSIGTKVLPAIATGVETLVNKVDWVQVSENLVTIADKLAVFINWLGNKFGDLLSSNKKNKDGKSTAKAVSDYAKKEKGALSKAAHGDIVGGATDFILNEDGEFDSISADKLKILTNTRTLSKAPQVAKLLGKAGLKTAKGVGKVGGKVGGFLFSRTKLGKFNKFMGKTKLGQFNKALAKEASEGLKNKTKSGIGKLGKKITNFKSDVSGLADLALEYGDDAYEAMGESALKSNLAKGLNKGRGLVNKVKGGASKVGEKVAGTKVGGALSKAGKAFKFVNKEGGAKELATKIVKSDAVKSVGQKVKKSAAGEGIEAMVKKLLSKLIKAYKWVGEKLGKKIGKKVATEAAEAAAEKGIKSAMKKGGSRFVKMITSGIAKITGKIAMAASTASIADAAFFTLGAIDYGSKGGTARLFQIDEEYVDAKMRIISTVIGGLLQVSWGAWVDLANELVASFMGINLISELACLLYKAISGKKKDNKLDEAREDFKSDYDEYVDSKIEKAYQKHLEEGTVPKNKDGSEMTLEEFTAAVNNGDIAVEHKSFDEYNKEKHKGVWAKAGSAIKKQFSTKKGRKEAAIKGALLLNPVTGAATLTYEGLKKTKVGKAIDKKAKKVTNAAKKKVKELGANISGAAKSAWSSIKGIGKKKKKKNKDAKKFSDMITASSKDLFASNTAKAKDTFGVIKSQSAAIWDNAKKSVSDKLSKVKGFLVGHKETAWYEQSGSYYVANGDAFDHYNANGDLIDSGVSSDSISELIDAGILTEGEIEGESGFSAKLKDIRGSLKSGWTSAFKKASLLYKGLKTKIGSMFKNITKNGIIGSIKKAISGSSKEAWFDPNGNYYVKNGKKYDYYNPNNDLIEKGIPAEEVEEKIQTGMLTKGTIQKDGSAKAAIKKIQSAVKESWTKAKNVVSSGWKKFKDWISGGSGTGNKNINSIKKSDYGDLSLMFGMGGSGGGRGDDIVNGMPYYSQNDSSWKNMKYGNDGATMGDSGCGPAAMSMIASKLTGQSVSPLETASLAELTGDRDSTGTNWNFIGKASAAYGIDNTQASNPSSGFIKSQLESGHPMILSGASGTGRGGRGGSPYTDAGHYVVATGIDSAGNISVSDPRGKSYNRKYNVNEVAEQTGMAWSFGRGGMGGGFGSSYADKVGQVLADLNGPSYKAPINNLSRGQCTWYAEGRAHEKYGWDEFTRRAMGNGGDIYYNAKSWGLDSGTEIKPNSLISRGGSSSYGHVLYVEDVDKENNMVYYSEGNSDGSGNAPDDGVIKSASLDDWNARKPYGYVYTKGSNIYSDADGTGTTSPSDDSSSSSDSNSSSSTGPSTENAISMLSSIFGEAGNRLINGMFTGSFDSDYSSFLSNTSSPDSSSDSSSSSEDNSSKTMIMVGDSRTVGICAALGGPNIQQNGYVGTAQNDIFIGKVGEGLAWLKSTGIELLKPNASKYVKSYIVIWLGVNDCAMGKPADCGKNYANFINNNIANLNRTVYVVTPAPCKDDGRYDAINKSLPEFNSGLKSGLDSSVHFIDLYNWFKSGIEDGSLVTTDGCHFNNDSYVKIVNKIKSKCGAGGGSGRGRARVIKTKNTLPNMWIDPSGGRNFITGGGRGNFYVTTDANGGKHYSNPLFNVGNKKFGFSYPNTTSVSAALADAGKHEWDIIKQAGSSTDKTYLGNEYAASTGKAGHRTVRTDNGEMTRWDYTVTVPDSAGGGSKTVQFVKSSDQELAGSKKIASSGIRDLWKRYYSEYAKKKQDWKDKKSRGDEDATETADDIDTEDVNNGLPNKWIECVKYVKKVFADELAPKKIEYAWAGHEFDFGPKGKKNFRKDCTGFVSACLWYYDPDTFSFVPSGGWTSHNFGGSNNSPKLIEALEKAGFKRLKFPGWDNLVCGDILIKHEQHGEIYCSGTSADNHQSWNCGSTEGLWEDGTIYGAGYDYEEIWRPPASAGSGTSSGSGASVENAISMMSGIMGEAGNRLINGMFTGKFDTDYSSYLAGTSSDESGSSDSSGSSGTTVDGSDARSITWNYLTKNGFSKAATAGTMGNMEGEVAKDYNNNSFPGDNKYVSTAEWEYGQYKSDDDVYDNGGGIIQWTPWKTKIGAYSKEKRGDIHAWTTDLPLQLEYLMSYIGDAIGSGSDYSLSGAGLSKNLVSNLEEFKKMTDVEQATRQWQAGVERPDNSVAHTDRRIGAAKWYYDNMESVKTGGGSGSGARISKPKYGKPWVQGGGGRGDGSSSTYSTPSIDYDNFGTQTDNAINNYKQTISTVKIDDTSAKDELLLKAVEILADIATNTGVASSKLDMLKSLGQKVNQNTFINAGGNTTNNVTTTNGSGSSGPSLTDKGESRNAVLARRIASGV
jgi:hypothetical protein